MRMGEQANEDAEKGGCHIIFNFCTEETIIVNSVVVLVERENEVGGGGGFFIVMFLVLRQDYFLTQCFKVSQSSLLEKELMALCLGIEMLEHAIPSAFYRLDPGMQFWICAVCKIAVCFFFFFCALPVCFISSSPVMNPATRYVACLAASLMVLLLSSAKFSIFSYLYVPCTLLCSPFLAFSDRLAFFLKIFLYTWSNFDIEFIKDRAPTFTMTTIL